MARGVTLESSQPLQRYSAVGRSISDMVSGTARGFASGVKMGQEQGEYERKEKEYERLVKEAEKKKEAFKELKKQTENELAGILKGKSFDYVDSRFKAVRSAQTVEDLQNIAGNIQAEIQVDQDYVKKYKDIQFGQVEGIGSVLLRNPEYGKTIQAGAQQKFSENEDKIHAANLREFMSKPENQKLNAEAAVRKYTTEYGIPLNERGEMEMNRLLKGHVSEGSQLAAQARRERLDIQKDKATAQMDDITNEAFKALQAQEAKLTNKILQEAKIDVRNLTDAAQFLASKEFNSLDAKRQEEMRNVVNKRDAIQKKVKLASAAAKIGMQGLTEAKIDVIYNDAIDADGPTAPETKQLWEAAGLTGITKPKVDKPKLDPERREKLKKHLVKKK